MRTGKLFFMVMAMLAACWCGYAEDASLLPADAVGVTIQSAPANDMMVAIEQRGFMPYKGRTCTDASTAFETGEDGKEYGDNEYTIVNLSIMHYKAEYKSAFDALLQMAHPSMNLKQEEENAKSGGTPHGSMLLSRSVNRTPVNDGEMLLITDAIRCIESEHPSYVQTTYQSYAIIGTSIVSINGSYNSSDAKLARRIHNETVAKVKKSSQFAN